VVRGLVLALVVASCDPSGPIDRSKTPFISATRTKTSVLCVPVTGATAHVKTNDGAIYVGELLAASSSRVVVLATDSGYVVERDAKEIESVTVDIYSTGAETALLTIWAFVGTVSALSHGYYFVFTGPAWAGVSSAVIAAVAGDGDRFAQVTRDFGRLSEYARFPAGMPPSFPTRQPIPPQPCQ